MSPLLRHPSLLPAMFSHGLDVDRWAERNKPAPPKTRARMWGALQSSVLAQGTAGAALTLAILLLKAPLLCHSVLPQWTVLVR